MRQKLNRLHVFAFCALFVAVIFTLFQIFCVSRSSVFTCDNHDTGQKSVDASLKQLKSELSKIPTIYLITPTHERPTQKADLTRLAYTLLHVPKIHWIIVEDGVNRTELVAKFLDSIEKMATKGFSCTHLNQATPVEYKTKEAAPNWLKPRGVLQRNAALKYLRDLPPKNIDLNSVVYFADDDNTYDLRLFEEMRWTKKVSCWPVGLVGGLRVERPLVDSNGKVYAFNSVWKPQRLFPIDMSSFAINIKLILRRRKAYFTLKVARGFQESYLLKQLISDISELEPKAENCTMVLVWHTRTERAKLNMQSKSDDESAKIEV